MGLTLLRSLQAAFKSAPGDLSPESLTYVSSSGICSLTPYLRRQLLWVFRLKPQGVVHATPCFAYSCLYSQRQTRPLINVRRASRLCGDIRATNQMHGFSISKARADVILTRFRPAQIMMVSTGKQLACSARVICKPFIINTVVTHTVKHFHPNALPD